MAIPFFSWSIVRHPPAVRWRFDDKFNRRVIMQWNFRLEWGAHISAQTSITQDCRTLKDARAWRMLDCGRHRYSSEGTPQNMLRPVLACKVSPNLVSSSSLLVGHADLSSRKMEVRKAGARVITGFVLRLLIGLVVK